MNFSEKQFDFIKYLLDKLNFDFTIENNFMLKYIEYISKTYVLYKNIGDCERTEILHKNEKKNIPKDGLPNIQYLDNGSFYEIKKFSLINFLQLEIDIKSKKKYIVKDKINLDFISATDISNYIYCPANYSISKTIHYKNLSTSIIGTKKHEESLINSITGINQNHINNKINKEKFDDLAFDNIENDDNYKLLKKQLFDFEIIYSGHTLNFKNKIFNSLKGKFIGQPDFILRNNKTNETIIIEEKFQHIPKKLLFGRNDNYFNNTEEVINAKRNKNNFHENHINQVASYVFGISDYNINYGILIYWKYVIHNNTQVISKCFFTKVHKKEETRFNLNETYKKILKFNKDKVIEFKVINRNPAKCASCVNNYLCGHKTGRFDKVTIPYNYDYVNIVNVPFPENLKKDINQVDKRTYIEKILDNISSNENKEVTETTATFTAEDFLQTKN